MVKLFALSRPEVSASWGHQTHQKKNKKNERSDRYMMRNVRRDRTVMRRRKMGQTVSGGEGEGRKTDVIGRSMWSGI